MKRIFVVFIIVFLIFGTVIPVFSYEAQLLSVSPEYEFLISVDIEYNGR